VFQTHINLPQARCFWHFERAKLWYGPPVLGQAQTPRRRLIGLAAVALAVLTAPAVGGADPTKTADALRRENAHLAEQSRSAVLGLYSLDSRLTAAQARLATLQQQERALRAERVSLERQLGVARAGTRIAQQRLASRLRLLYEQGDVSELEVLFGARSLDDALTGIENLNRVTALDESVLTEVRTARARLTHAAGALERHAAQIAAARQSAAATATALEQAKAERTAYVSQLASRRQLNSAQIGSLEAQARAAAVRSMELQRSAPDTALAAETPSSVSAVAPAATASVAGGRTITVSATGYALSGTTATGIPVGWGVVAVDPGVIPLGTHMTIPGYGEAVAADTGGAIVGATIDLWFPSVAQAQAWGRRTVTITLH
jgi:cystine transport system substrate-binding protein